MLRDLVTGGGALPSPVTRVEVGAVLVTLMAAAPRPTAGAIGLGQRAKEGTASRARKLAEQSVSGFLNIRNRHNRL